MHANLPQNNVAVALGLRLRDKERIGTSLELLYPHKTHQACGKK